MIVGPLERWLSAQPGQDYKHYIDPRALAEEARHLIVNAAEPQPSAPAGEYARTLDATARRAQQRDPDRGIDR
jgi:hypothetical protein